MSVRTLPVDAQATLPKLRPALSTRVRLRVERIGRVVRRPPGQLAGLRACVAESDNTEVSIDHSAQRAGDQTVDP